MNRAVFDCCKISSQTAFTFDENSQMPEVQISSPALNHTPAEIINIYRAQQAFFKTGVTRSFAFRKAQLNVLKQAIKRHEPQIMEALYQDLRKSNFESYGTEIGQVYEEINYAIKHLKEWMQPERVSTPLMFFPGTSKIYQAPLGTVLIICPWNYPFYLLLVPLIAAIAGGNTSLLKPSEHAPQTEMIINTLVNETFEPEYIASLNIAGEQLNSTLIEQHHLDHIFFTGSIPVGKKIMEAAARQLSPVTLELGGKSPCIVAADARLDYAAKKIAWSKWMNAGQVCVAPDYLLVHEKVKDKLVQKIILETEIMFGKNPQKSADYPRIINEKRWQTLVSYLDEGTVVHGGQHHLTDKYIAPTIIENVPAGSRLMHEEIFGPILPVFSYTTEEDVLQFVDQNPYPLACYIYTEHKKTEQYFIENIRFGGGCINNGLVHLGNPGLPFGGVGYSGMGRYHGKHGFETFTHKKAILKSSSALDLPVWYAPFKDHLKYLRKLMK